MAAPGGRSTGVSIGPATPTRLLIVCRLRVFRDFLATSFEQDRRIEIVGSTGRMRRALLEAQRLHPDVVLLEVDLPHALQGMRLLVEVVPDTRVLAFGVRQSAADVLRWAEAGACGYVVRDASLEEIVGAVRRAARGELLCSPSITNSLFRRIADLAAGPAASSGPLSRLTERERQIAELIAQGLSNKQIGRQLSISLSTVKNHVHHILEKLQVPRRAGVAALVAQYRPWDAPAAPSSSDGRPRNPSIPT
jgi:two-component system, NarL family, nitrate/nitrite response regulator NarL